MMEAAVIYKVADIALTLFQVGLERESIVSAIKAREEAGDTPEQLIAFMVSARNAAQAKAHDALLAASKQG